MKLSGHTTIEITNEDADWASNSRPYKWGPYYGAGTYEVRILKTEDRELWVCLRVPGESEVTLKANLIQPPANSIRVSLHWDVRDGYKMSQNGQNPITQAL